MDDLDYELNEEQINYVLKYGTNQEKKIIKAWLNSPYLQFKPITTEQQRFIQDDNLGISVILGGSGSGKTEVGAYKLAKKLKETPPPDDLCKVFIVSEVIEQACNIWCEKLRHYFKPGEVDSIEWHRAAAHHPKSVILKPRLNGNRWQLIFRSAQQGTLSFAGYNDVAGFFIDEPINLDVVLELWARCRKYEMPGMKFWSMTPILPFPQLEKIYNNQETNPQWRFFRFSTRDNTTLKDLSFLDATPEDMRMTREHGYFCNMSGAVFKEWDYNKHVYKDIPTYPDGEWKHYRVIDWGYEHNTACIWAKYHSKTDKWYVHNEWAKSGLLIKEKFDAISKLVEWGKGPQWFTYADSEDPQQRREFSELGMPTLVPRKEPVSASIESTRMAMMINPTTEQPRLYIHEGCTKLIEQITSYRWMPAPKMGNRPSPQKVIKVNDDLVDCLRMLMYTTDKRTQIKPW